MSYTRKVEAQRERNRVVEKDRKNRSFKARINNAIPVPPDVPDPLKPGETSEFRRDLDNLKISKTKSQRFKELMAGARKHREDHGPKCQCSDWRKK